MGNLTFECFFPSSTFTDEVSVTLNSDFGQFGYAANNNTWDTAIEIDFYADENFKRREQDWNISFMLRTINQVLTW